MPVCVCVCSVNLQGRCRPSCVYHMFKPTRARGLLGVFWHLNVAVLDTGLINSTQPDGWEHKPDAFWEGRGGFPVFMISYLCVDASVRMGVCLCESERVERHSENVC